MAVIEAHELTKRFGEVLAVDGLSFELEAGTVTGFLGPNGAGKTTTLRMLLGLVSPTGGRSAILGRPYGELVDPALLVGAALEASGFHPGRRAADHLRVVAVATGAPNGRVAEVLDCVGLTEAGNRRVKGFSLGMRQRLALAAALLGTPQVLILDEPANGLDPEGIQWLRRLLRQRADEGCTVVVSSHVLAEVAQTVDDVLIIARGRLVTHAPLQALTERATQIIRVRTPQAEALRDALASRGRTAELRGEDLVVVLKATTKEVGLTAAGHGIVIYEMTTEHASLEDTFFALTSATNGDPR
ncbi:MAG: ATP-binding cassette domain-containing protein [Acidimicrobiales bacterium]